MNLTVHIPDEAVPALTAKASGLPLETFAELFCWNGFAMTTSRLKRPRHATLRDERMMHITGNLR